jgi:hypothetical protein
MEENHIVKKYRTEAFSPVLDDSEAAVSWIRGCIRAIECPKVF